MKNGCSSPMERRHPNTSIAMRRLIDEARGDPRPSVDGDTVFNRLIDKYETMANDGAVR
jgi:hypothetical protein